MQIVLKKWGARKHYQLLLLILIRIKKATWYIFVMFPFKLLIAFQPRPS